MEFIVLADNGTGTNYQKKVAKSMEKLIESNPQISNIIIAGDNIYPEGCIKLSDNKFDSKFQNPYKNINLPFHLCLGNHDYGYEKDNSQTQIDYTNSSYNHNKKWNLPSKWYTKKFQCCEIFFIDTNFDKLTLNEINKQYDFIKNKYKKSKSKWKILCGHHTLRSIAFHGNAEPQHEEFMNRLYKNKIRFDLYLCGHDHCKTLIMIGKYKIPTLVIGTGGENYTDNKLFFNNLKKDNSVLYYFSPNLGVCHMKCDEISINLTCYNENLIKEYSHTILK